MCSRFQLIMKVNSDEECVPIFLFSVSKDWYFSYIVSEISFHAASSGKLL